MNTSYTQMFSYISIIHKEIFGVEWRNLLLQENWLELTVEKINIDSGDIVHFVNINS